MKQCGKEKEDSWDPYKWRKEAREKSSVAVTYVVFSLVK